jgi:hypothetical protein
MTTGFVQRFKGKIAAAEIYVGGVPTFSPGILQSTTIAGAAAEIGTLTNYGVSAVTASTVLAVARLASPQYPGQQKVIELVSVSSGIKITASTDGSVTFNGGTYNTITSTLAGNIALMAGSTTNWVITGVYPSTTGFPTLSTTT